MPLLRIPRIAFQAVIFGFPEWQPDNGQVTVCRWELTITAAKVISNGESTTWDKCTVDAIPMYNIVRGPAPGKFLHDKGRGNGNVLTYSGMRFYFSGDTEGIPEMRALKNIVTVGLSSPICGPPLAPDVTESKRETWWGWGESNSTYGLGNLVSIAPPKRSGRSCRSGPNDLLKSPRRAG